VNVVSMNGILDKSRTVAGPGFNRWLVPPAALAIHLCIGEVYGFSVFNKPLSQAIGITTSAPGDWSIPALGWIFSLAILCLGLAAAFCGRWVETAGPRTAMVTAAALFGGGLVVGGLGVAVHQLWLLYLGYGVIGGCGLGIGYISPVKTLISWFPDRPGLATGTAIMGFGGGALIGAPLAVLLMKHFSGPASTGAAPTMIVMGVAYFLFMLIGAAIVRTPAPGWSPPGHVEAAESVGMVTAKNVTVSDAVRTPQFWLLWAMLCLNVTAGIGVLGQASLMIQEMFPERFPHGTVAAVAAAAIAASGFVGLLSIFNMLGRIAWASGSDFLGRKRTYAIFFALGTVLYALVPWTGRTHDLVLFVLFYGIILSMYGGGFATIPAYLKDVFGSENVGAIHGRLLTAWSAAGILGPVLVNYIREYQLAHGVDKADAYSVTMYVMAVLLVAGFACNYFMRPISNQAILKDATASAEPVAASPATTASRPASGSNALALAAAWAVVTIPLLWGVWLTLVNVAHLFAPPAS
jgi:MFS family permease